MEPSVEHIYVHQDQLSVYVPAHNQVLKGSLTMMVSTKAPLRLLQGVGKLAEHFLRGTGWRWREGGKRVAVIDADPQDPSRFAVVVARQSRVGNSTTHVFDSIPRLA